MQAAALARGVAHGGSRFQRKPPGFRRPFHLSAVQPQALSMFQKCVTRAVRAMKPKSESRDFLRLSEC
jgi:hypothetical protein